MTKKELTDLLPIWFQRIREYPEIMSAYAYAFTEAKLNLDKVSQNLYFQTCDVQTLADWERLMSIYPAPDESIEIRRKTVMARWSMTGKYDAGYFRAQFNVMFGIDNYEFYKFYTGAPYFRSYMVLELKSYVPGSKSLAYGIWYKAAPAHMHLEVYDRYEASTSVVMYFGGTCSQTIILNI